MKQKPWNQQNTGQMPWVKKAPHQGHQPPRTHGPTVAWNLFFVVRLDYPWGRPKHGNALHIHQKCAGMLACQRITHPKKNMGNMKHSLVSLAIPLLNWAGERLNAFQIWLTSRKIPSSMLRVDSPKPNIQLADRPSRLFSQRLTMHRYRNESGSCSWKTWMSRAKSWWHGAKHESNILSLIEKSLYKCRKLVVTLPQHLWLLLLLLLFSSLLPNQKLVYPLSCHIQTNPKCQD